MATHAQRQVLLALSRGLVAPRDLGALLRTPVPGSGRRKPEAWDDVLQALIDSGKLDPEVVAELGAAADAADDQRGIPGQWPGAGSGTASRRSGPRSRRRQASLPATGDETAAPAEWGRLTIVGALGSGGMGEVYKAYDPALERYVAVKILRSADSDTVERFMREARTQARIDHPNICHVHEVGEIDGTPYISMQYIDGQTLDRAAEGMALEQKVSVMIAVADALHAAHRVGLIHRDIKPSNIMIERGPDGEWRPFVVDFGLVRDAQADGLTMTGEVMGTPSYMAPEQARGQLSRLDRRTDVYSLGCVLYELLAGLPPFVAASGMDVLVKMLREEPEPLRRRHPDVPVDLETIALKCLEKEPARRYDSARALSEDLRRFLDGDAIEARRASLAYRLGKKVRKHRVATAIAAIAATAVIASAVVVGATLARARDQAAAARRFGEEIKTIESLVRTSALLPLHDTTREMALVRERLQGIENQARELGAAARGPAQYALGRGALAMHRVPAARAHLEAAWRLGHREPEVAYALGLTFGALYQRALEDAQRVGIPELRAEKRRQAEVTLRTPALAYLKSAQGAVADSPAYAEALIAFFEGHRDRALAGARQAFAQAPWQYEAKRLEGDILVAGGEDALERGDLAEAGNAYTQAGEAYAAALAIGRSDSALYESEGNRWMRIMELEISRGARPALAYARGLEACSRALQADPAGVPALIAQTHLHWRYGAYLARQGGDPRPTLASALAAGIRAVEAGPDDAEAHLELGLARWTAAEVARDRGEDLVPDLEGATISFQRALALNPGDILALNGLGAANSLRADHEAELGRDPRPYLAEASDAYRKALEIKPDFARALNNLGLTLQTRAEYEIGNDLPSDESLNGAADAFRRAIAINPAFAPAAANLGNTLWTRAEIAIRQGEDPSKWLDEAIAGLHQALTINPHYARALASLGGVHTTRAGWLVDSGQSPEADLLAARNSLERAQAIDASDLTLQFRGAEIYLFAARWAAHQGRSPLADLEHAEATLLGLVARSPEIPEGHVYLAEIHWRRGEWLARTGRPASLEISAGLGEANEALKLKPRMVEAVAMRGALRTLSAEATQGAQRVVLARMAIDDLAEASRLDASVTKAYGQVLARARALVGN